MNPTQLLINAIQAGDPAAAESILSTQPQAARGTGDNGQSPVLEALYRGHAELAVRTAQGRDTTLVEAAALGDEARVRALATGGRSALSERSSDGWTALHLAAFFGRAGTVRVLIDAGADLEARSANYMENTALCAAIAGATDTPTVAALLDAGADASARAAAGVRPIHLAASRGTEPVVKALLERGARADVATDDGKTAAQFASERGHASVAAFLESITGRSQRPDR